MISIVCFLIPTRSFPKPVSVMCKINLAMNTIYHALNNFDCSLIVVLESTVAAPSFRGFLIQARLVADDMTVVGQFEEPPAGGEYRHGSCANREVENILV